MEIVFFMIFIVIFYVIIKGAVETGTYDALVKFDKYKQEQNKKSDY